MKSGSTVKFKVTEYFSFLTEVTKQPGLRINEEQQRAEVSPTL